MELYPQSQVCYRSCPVMLAVMTSLAFWSVRNFQDDSNLVSHTNQVIARLEEIRSLVNKAEADQGRYLISQQAGYLTYYKKSRTPCARARLASAF